jgi:hypothetical protein
MRINPINTLPIGTNFAVGPTVVALPAVAVPPRVYRIR